MRGKAARHNRFYLVPDNVHENGNVAFSRSESKHMLSSLRLKVGDFVTAADGRGSLYGVRIERTSGREVAGKIVDCESVARAEPHIHLFQAVIRPARMELVVEKATELGVWGITPVQAARSTGAVGPARLGRLRKTAVEAMKQSLGAYLPEITLPADMDGALEASRRFDFIVLALAGNGVPTALQTLQAYRGGSIALWIGPEGGFSDSESLAIRALGAEPFTLGSRRLRSETAAIACLAVLRALTDR